MTTQIKKIYTYQHDFQEFIQALDSKEPLALDSEMFDYFLEVLPPIYMNKKQLIEIDGAKIIKNCSFGFAEGRDYVIDFWRDSEIYFCKRSNRLNPWG